MALAYNEPKYQIDAPAFRCHGCSEEVPCEATYYSAVFFEEEAFRRHDYCPRCWEKHSPQPESAESQVFAFWRTRRPPLPTAQPKRIRFDTEVVFEFFQRLDPDWKTTGAREGEAEGEGSAESQGNENGKSGDTALPGRAEREELRFVLSLLLIRKKVLNFQSSRNQDGAEWLKLTERKGSRRCHWVRNPELNDAQLGRVKDRIGDLLQMQI